jgi:8-oxo-dGTP pyrophosphatase MutT (NUDIX family)
MSKNQSLSEQALRAAQVLRNPGDFKSKAKEALPESAIRLAGSAREVYWRSFHPFTFGAAVALSDVEVTEVALVRLKYGNTKLWQLPGGGLDKEDKKIAKHKLLNGVHANRLPEEYFLPSAVREVKEELGVEVESGSATHVGNYSTFSWLNERVPANKDTLGIFHVPLIGIDEIEFDIQKTEIDAVKLWDLGNILDRTVETSRPDPNIAWYMGSVATKLIASSADESIQQLPA